MKWGKSEESESRVTDARDLKQGRNRSLDTVIAQHHLESRREILTTDGVNDDTRVLFHLLYQGLLDQEVMDRPRDGATRVMRYSAVMGEWLWRLINGNIAQVGGLEAYSFDE